MNHLSITCTLLFLSILNSNAQDSFYSGTWTTTLKDVVNPNNEYYNIQTITLTPFKKNKILKITSIKEELDSIVKAFNVEQDGLSWGSVIWEDSQAFIEGKNFEVELYDDNSSNDNILYFGKWEAIKADTEETFSSEWIAFNNSSPFKLNTAIAMFKSDKEFILKVNDASIGCGRDGYIVIYINETPIRETRNGTNALKRFYPGATVYGVGTRISVKSFANCSEGNGIKGSFKFKN